MYCPNCGSNNHVASEICTQCGAHSGALAAAAVKGEAAVEERAEVVYDKYRSGRRKTILGVLLLAGATLILLALKSKGLPPFLALLWTCWIFLWGVIAVAEGAARWLSAYHQIKALAYSRSHACPGKDRRWVGSGPGPTRRGGLESS